jgi:hypothetical protein
MQAGFAVRILSVFYASWAIQLFFLFHYVNTLHIIIQYNSKLWYKIYQAFLDFYFEFVESLRNFLETVKAIFDMYKAGA